MLAFLAGCVYVPTVIIVPSPRWSASAQMIGSGATRSQVIRHLGEPDLQSADRRNIAYVTCKYQSYWVWPEFLIWYTALEHGDGIRLTFDADDKVVGTQSFEASYLRTWIPVPHYGEGAADVLIDKMNQGVDEEERVRRPSIISAPATRPSAIIKPPMASAGEQTWRKTRNLNKVLIWRNNPASATGQYYAKYRSVLLGLPEPFLFSF
jgi:hypothetical protein